MQVNHYFNDQVLSIGFENAAGTQSAGVMQPGEYVFDTSKHETMTVISGALTIKREGDADFVTFNAGDSFEVPAGQDFDVRVSEPTAYLCHYA